MLKASQFNATLPGRRVLPDDSETQLDPTNSDARRYVEILKKNLNKAQLKASAKGSQNTGRGAATKPVGNTAEARGETSKANE